MSDDELSIWDRLRIVCRIRGHHWMPPPHWPGFEGCRLLCTRCGSKLLWDDFNDGFVPETEEES